MPLTKLTGLPWASLLVPAAPRRLEKSPCFMAAVGIVVIPVKPRPASPPRRLNDGSLVIAENEELVPDDGTAQSGAKLVLFKLSSRFAPAVVRPGVRVEVSVL